MSTPANPSPQVSRRRFLRTAALGSVGVAAFAGGAGLLAMFLSDRGGRDRVRAELTIPPADLPTEGGAPYRHSDGHFFLIQNEDGALALSWTCTHQGCTVRWHEGRNDFECPCHSSLFDRHGVVTSGPAPRPLDLMPLRVEGDAVIVDTRETIQRDAYSPDQAVPLET